jgi:hypothetical protein
MRNSIDAANRPLPSSRALRGSGHASKRSPIQKGRTPGWVAQAILGREVWLTFVAVGELAKWAEVRSWAPQPGAGSTTGWRSVRSFRTTQRWPAPGASWPLPPSGEGVLVPQNDMWVAACCIRHQLPLVTLNQTQTSASPPSQDRRSFGPSN